MSLAFLSRFGRNVLYGFRRELRPYEALILEHVLEASTPTDRAALRLQLESRERVRRWSDRMLYFGLPPSVQLPRIAEIALDHCYAKILLSASKGKVTAKVMTHRGLLSTVEFSKAPAPLLSEGVSVKGVFLHPGGGGYTAEIDAIEHGEPTDA